MKELFAIVSEEAVIVVNTMALLVIAFASLQAFISVLPVAFRLSPSNTGKGVIWNRYARWLVAGLTLQLGADIIETAVAPGWEDIGRLAAVAVIRTFLNYFLDRDIAEAGKVSSVASDE